MTTAPDLGDIGQLARAFGLVDADGSVVTDWFSSPGDHLATMLGDAGQREALLGFVDSALGGAQGGVGPDGKRRVPLAARGGVSASMLVDDRTDPDWVALGLAVDVDIAAASDRAGCTASVVVPLVATPVAGGGAASQSTKLVLGGPGGVVHASVSVVLPSGASVADVRLAAVELAVDIPTGGPETPHVRLALNGLALPGAASPRDVVVDASSLDQLDDALLQLVLGVVRAQADALPDGDPLRGLARLLGLDGSAVPDFPVMQLAEHGISALADWLAQALSANAPRAAWLQGLADLVGGTVAGTGAAATAQVHLGGGGGPLLQMGVDVAPGTGGLPRVTPHLEVGLVVDDSVALSLRVDPVTLDLGSGAAVALPRLDARARVSGPAGGDLLPTTSGPGGVQVKVGALVAGLALDDHRRPAVVLGAESVRVGSTDHAFIDLSSPEALADAGGALIADAVAALLAKLGPAAEAIGQLLGVTDLAGTSLPRIDVSRLVSDPVGALAARWSGVLDASSDDVTALLRVLRDVVAEPVAAAVDVTGTGTPTDPWRVGLAGVAPVHVTLLVHAEGATGARTLVLRLEAAAVVDDLGGGHAGAALLADVEVVRIGLQTARAQFLTSVTAGLVVTGASGGPLSLGLGGDVEIGTRAVGLQLRWTPSGGLSVSPRVDALAVRALGAGLDLPDGLLDPATLGALPAAAWAQVEDLLALLAQRSGSAWLGSAAQLLGWGVPSAGRGRTGAVLPRLSLSGLVADPAAALRGWVAELVAAFPAQPQLVTQVLDALAPALGLSRAGAGHAADPWRLLLSSGADVDAAALLGLGGAAVVPPTSAVPPQVRHWLPGDTGLAPEVLVDALVREGTLDPALADVLAGLGTPDGDGNGGPVAGLAALLSRWASTDGVVGAPAADAPGLPTGATRHLIDDRPHLQPLADLDLTSLDGFGAAPATLVLVATDVPGAPSVLPTDTPADHVLDLTTSGVPPSGAPHPVAATGTWVVRLGTRDACRLASGDASGVLGQAGRLQAVIESLAPAGDLVVVAHGGAGHAAARAVADLTAAGTSVRALVTVGTPWSSVLLSALDDPSVHDALHLLAALLPDAATAGQPSGADPDAVADDDLTRSLSLVAHWLALDGLADPLAELRPPDGTPPAPGVPVHAVFGVLAQDTVLRAVTAAVSARLAARAAARASALGVDESGSTGPVDVALANVLHLASGPTGVGLRLPALRTSGGGLGVRAQVDVRGLPLAPELVVSVDLRAQSGWLVGGPDPGRAGRGPRTLGVRRVSVEVGVPVALGSSPPPEATAQLVLHDVLAFGVRRARWVVDLADLRAAAAAGLASPPPPPTVDVGVPLATPATALAPEVRALLTGVAARLSATSDPALAPVRAALTALGLLAPAALAADGSPVGIDLTSLEQLLLDPRGFLHDALADPTRRGTLATALRGLAGDDRAPATAGDSVRFGGTSAAGAAVVVDLATGSVSASAGSTLVAPLGVMTVGWDVTAEWRPGTAPQITLRLGADLSGPAADLAGGVPACCLLLAVDAGAAPGARVGAELRLRLPSRARAVPLLSGAGLGGTGLASAGPDLLRAVEAAMPAALLQAALTGLRVLAAEAGAGPGTAVDGLLGALGLLGPPDAQGTRGVLLPAALLADPAGWLRTLPGGLLAAVPGLVDAARSLLGTALPAGPSGPGQLPLHAGVALVAAPRLGRLALELSVDAGALAGGGGPRLLPSGAAGVVVDSSGRALPDVSVAIGIDGTGAVRLTVGPLGDGTVGTRLELAPDGSPAITLVPAGPGLPAAAAAAAVPALAAVLTTLAGGEPVGAPATPREVAGSVVGVLGRALALGAGTPCVFDPAALRTFGADPAAAFAARAPALTALALQELATALGPLVGTGVGRSLTVVSGRLQVTVGGFVVGVDPGTRQLHAEVHLTGLPGVERLDALATVSPAGLDELDVTVGPAELHIPAQGGGDLTVLRPVARVRTSTTVSPTGVSVEIGLGVGSSRRFAVRFAPGAVDPVQAVAVDGSSETTEVGAVAAVAIAAVADIVSGVVLSITAVHDALATTVLGAPLSQLLEHVLLDATGSRLDPTLADDLLGVADHPERLLTRLGALLRNVAAAGAAGIEVAAGLKVLAAADGDRLGVRLQLTQAVPLTTGDLVVELCPSGGTEELWPHDAPGITAWLASVPADGPVTVSPGVLVEDLGLRIHKSSGPLVDSVVRLDGVGVHLLGEVDDDGGGVTVRFGARVELTGLAVALAGAGGSGGGTNPVASGLVHDTGGGAPPRPAFSPTLVVVVDTVGAVKVGLSAGPGTGPWWVVIQKGFGPVYIEQVGLSVVVEQDQLQRIGVALDAKVSLLGLTAAVDDLSLTYVVASSASAFDPSHWDVDIAGFAVTADIAGLSLAGGLRKFPVAAGGSEYVGMLLARLAAYGITVYGGYGLVGPPGDQFASLFLFGAVNGPIGGPPAFFITGIGGGLGINRGLLVPTDMSQFGTFPLIKALDPSARPGDPMTELQAVRGYFPVQRGSFWFAAGISFNSFALVDGIAVLAVQAGDGLEITLLGLARMALPRPEIALVSIELALVARFSTKEGILLVQAQLTDNSWLLYPDVRLTGGFAFAAWFAGPNRGQFVLTIGGYHSAFHRDGYPIVPRLGFVWKFGPVMIQGGSFFALTSEAVMAGQDFEAHAEFGPAWVHLRLGGEGIIFFDPFHLRIDIWAEISAGITIDVWIGTITISISLGATVMVEAPPFHAVATVHVGPAELTVEIGDQPSPPPGLDWAAFVPKYLEEAAAGVAHVLAVVPGAGLVVPAGSSQQGGAPTPDGTDVRPFRVQPEFQLTVTSTAPVALLTVGADPQQPLDTGGVVIGVAPMGLSNSPPAVTLVLSRTDGGVAPARHPAGTPQRLGAFPLGVWGAPGDPDHPTVPQGAVAQAVDRVLLTSSAQPLGQGPDVLYRQVETDHRRPLPLLRAAAARTSLVTRTRTTAALLDGLLPDGADATARAIGIAAGWVAGGRTAAEGAAWSADRAAPPRLGTLGEGLARTTANASTQAVTFAPAGPPQPRTPVVRALLAGPGGDPDPAVAQALGRPQASTTVSAALLMQLGLSVGSPAAGPVRGARPPSPARGAAAGPASTVTVTAPPRLADVAADLLGPVAARLVRAAPAAAVQGRTVVATGTPPTTRTGRAGSEHLDVRGADGGAVARLRAIGDALLRGEPVDKDPAGVGRTLQAGELVLLDLPDAARDPRTGRPTLVVRGGSARAVVVDGGGAILGDSVLGAEGSVAVPVGGARVAVLALGDLGAAAGTPAPAAGSPDRLCGWHAGQVVPYVGLGAALATGAVLRAAGRGARRGSDRLRAGHLPASDLVAGESAVTTTFAWPVLAVAVVVEGGSADGADLGLAGATLATDAAGSVLPPTAVASGARGAVVHAVVPSGDGPVRVTVATSADRRLVAVLGLAAGPDDGDPTAGDGGASAARLAASLAASGPEPLLPPPVPPGTGGVLLAWKEG